MSRRPSARLFACGHFVVGDRCDICSDRAAAQAAASAAEAAKTEAASSVDPTHARPIADVAGVQESTAGAIEVTSATFIEGLDDAVYLSGGVCTPGPQLSQTLIKLLIPPSTPAHFQWRINNPEPFKRVFDIGRAAHTLVLGVGQPMAACPPDLLAAHGAMSTKASKAWADAQRAKGITPLNPSDYRMVCDMAEALAREPRVAELISDTGRRFEVSAFAPAPAWGDAWLRGRFDVMGGGLWDYKTTRIADPEQWSRSAYKYGYHIQDLTYRQIYQAVTGEPAGPMGFIVQEKEPPYLCSTVMLADEFAVLAEQQVAEAADLYLRCVRDFGAPSGPAPWPGYPAEWVEVYPPAWASPYDDEIEV